jgi:hypothetical protein
MAAPKRHLHNANQRITASELTRIGKLSEQSRDELLRRLLVAANDGLRLAQGESGYMPGGDDCKVVHVGGDRSTGVTFNIGTGLGWKYLGALELDAEEPQFQPIYVGAVQAVVAENSDATNPRIDRIFLKPRRLAGGSLARDVIDPVTKNISSTPLNTETAWTYEHAYVAGTPAASPAAPAPPAGFTAEDCIAEILMSPGSGAFNPVNLTDKRTLLRMDSGLVPGVTSLPASSITIALPLLDAHAQAALERHEAEIEASVPHGLVTGIYEYVNTESVKLRRALSGQIRVEIDGAVLVKSDADLIFDLTMHLDTGSEASSTFYYCYVFNSGGSLVQKISATAPVLDAASGKVGYHPTNTGWRYLFAFRNNVSSNIIPFHARQHEPGGKFEVVLRGAAGSVTPAESATSHSTVQDGNVASSLPATAREGLIHAEAECNDIRLHLFDGDRISEAITAASKGPYTPYTVDQDRDGSDFASHWAWLRARASDRHVGYARTELPGGSNYTTSTHKLTVYGWRD